MTESKIKSVVSGLNNGTGEPEGLVLWFFLL